ncbi:MAG: sigma-70 family RNA polymerase sigma factor [Bacteroidia bacterium]|nr:sigma-70 family RNA polymerase sigma factor [Bacteroidia bacterium]
MFFRKKPDISPDTDETLAQRYREKNDTAAAGVLFERYTGMVYLVCMKYLREAEESEDMAMQIFEKLLTDLQKYEVRNFRYWLHAVIKSQCLAHLEKQKRIQHERLDQNGRVRPDMESAESDAHTWEGETTRESQLVMLEQAISTLNEEQRRCLQLFYLEQKSYQEVSDSTGYTMKQVKSYIQNGKRNLQNHLGKMGIFE